MSSAFAKGFGVTGSVLVLFAVISLPVVARAQEPPALRTHHLTVGAGVVWSGGYDIGDATAQLRGNAPGATPPPFTLFTAKSRVTHAISPEVRAGYGMTPRIQIELGVAFSRPRVAVEIARDAEAPSQRLAGEQLQQYLIDGGVTWQLPVRLGTRVGARMAPFVSGGATFLRQLHQDRTLAETGQVYYAGGGARYWLRGADGTSRALGLRGDARVNFRTNGIDFEDKMRTYPTFSVAVFVGF